jgi:glyoxylase-like metal-dependent hydrolase (beta-lactamase superfamily II)
VAPAAATAWTDVATGVRVRQSRAFMMNSAVLADREHTIVIDPGVLPSELDDIAAAVTKLAPQRVTLFVTHGHWITCSGRRGSRRPRSSRTTVSPPR